MLTRLRILNKKIEFPRICPSHPDKLSKVKIRVTTSVVRKFFDKNQMDKQTFFDEELFVPVCEICAKKFNLYKQFSKWLVVLGLLGFIPLILLGNFAPNYLDKFDSIWPLVVISLFSCIYIGWGLGYLAKRKLVKISPRYRGENFIDIDIYCKKQYLEQFLKINCCKERGLFDS